MSISLSFSFVCISCLGPCSGCIGCQNGLIAYAQPRFASLVKLWCLTFPEYTLFTMLLLVSLPSMRI